MRFILDFLRQHSSVTLAYSPLHDRRAAQGSFTAALELQPGRQFSVWFYQHMATTRQVYNPMEEGDVVGITNYVDLGLALAMPLVGKLMRRARDKALGGAEATAAQQAASMFLQASISC